MHRVNLSRQAGILMIWYSDHVDSKFEISLFWEVKHISGQGNITWLPLNNIASYWEWTRRRYLNLENCWHLDLAIVTNCLILRKHLVIIHLQMPAIHNGDIMVCYCSLRWWFSAESLLWLTRFKTVISFPHCHLL